MQEYCETTTTHTHTHTHAHAHTHAHTHTHTHTLKGSPNIQANHTAHGEGWEGDMIFENTGHKLSVSRVL